MRFDETRTFGVEIEAYGVRAGDLARALTDAGVYTIVEHYNHTTRRHWKIVHDATVPGSSYGENATGWELVSPPLRGREGLREVETVCSVLNQLGAKVNRRCGLHVHHEARDFGVNELKNVIKLYGRMEKTLDEGMPKSRRGRGNGYAGSVYEKLRFGQDAFNTCQTTEQLRSWMGTRYLKLNIESWWRYGTIEFRHHSGMTQAEKVVNWIVLTQGLINRSFGRVQLIIKEGDHMKRTNPWRLVAYELGLGQSGAWQNTDENMQTAVRWFAGRITHFRQLEAA